MARNAGAPPREERAEPSRAEIEQGCRQMFEVDKPISSSRPALSHVKAAQASAYCRSFASTRSAKRGSCRAPGCTELTVDGGDRGFESCFLQRRVQCEPDADDFLAAGGAVLAEPLADRAQREMPAQPVLCRPVVIRRFLPSRGTFFDRFV